MMFHLAPPSVLALIGPIGTPELVILAIIGLLIFGKRLPEVGKSVGKGIVEFKRGLQGIEEDLDQASKQTREPQQPPQQLGSAAQPGGTIHQPTEADQQQPAAGGPSA